jgi:ABC-2 type transport system ATP-binding protein
MNAIEFHSLSKFYGKHRGIEGIDFTVSKGEVFGFIGPNGAGKSTAYKNLIRIITPK